MKYLLSAVIIFLGVACSPASSMTSSSYGVKVSKSMRDGLLAKAKVWGPPETSTASFDFLEGEPGKNAIRSTDEITCSWDYKEPQGGATPKFRCRVKNGPTHKIKYAKNTKNDNGEIPAEIAATRLMRALGFGADRMYTAKRVRCIGCPEDPWFYSFQLHSEFEKVRNHFLRTYGEKDSDGNYAYKPDFRKTTDFTFVSLEQRFGEHAIEYEGGEGWTWKELQKVSEARGGSSRSEIDALILMAVFLQHTDNKPSQQRIVCPTSLEKNGDCSKPMLIIQDLGATFGGPYKGAMNGGHTKFDHTEWKLAPFWTDRENCMVDIIEPSNGSFTLAQITENGRQFLASLLNKLSDQQIYDLFKGARAHEYRGASLKTLDAWVDAFKQRRTMITEGPACPK